MAYNVQKDFKIVLIKSDPNVYKLKYLIILFLYIYSNIVYYIPYIIIHLCICIYILIYKI